MQQQESTSPYGQSYQTKVSHRQRHLPPPQEIVKSESGASTDRRLKSEDDWDFSSGYLDCSASSTPLIVSSPSHSIGTLIPSLNHTFDELDFCTGDTMLSGSNGWGITMQYSAASGVYGVNSAASQPYYGRTTPGTGRSQHQNLPSLTDMHLPDRTPSSSSSRPSQMPRQYADSDYYSPSATDALDISYTKNSEQGYSSSFGVVTTPRTSYPITGYDNWSPVSDGYCCPNGHSWPPTMPCSSSGYGGSDTASLHSPRRRRGNLPKEVTEILRAWFQEHLDHPYPTEVDKQMLIAKTQLSLSQISNWFINARRRHWPQMKQNRDHLYKLPARTHY